MQFLSLSFVSQSVIQLIDRLTWVLLSQRMQFLRWSNASRIGRDELLSRSKMISQSRIFQDNLVRRCHQCSHTQSCTPELSNNGLGQTVFLFNNLPNVGVVSFSLSFCHSFFHLHFFFFIRTSFFGQGLQKR